MPGSRGKDSTGDPSRIAAVAPEPQDKRRLPKQPLADDVVAVLEQPQQPTVMRCNFVDEAAGTSGTVPDG